MKRILIILSLLILAACKPEAYLGPLDSPVGNWEGYKGDYYFNGEMVAELDSCVFKAISFYKQGFCCMEGIKGAFAFIYDNASGDLQIDSTLWNVPALTGAEMVMKFISRIYPPEPEVPETPEAPAEPETPEEPDEPEAPEEPVEPEEPVVPEEPEVKPDANGVILPAEYRGFTINADKNGYYYMNSSDKKVYCNFKGEIDASGALCIDFWYDTHTSYYIPLVREVKK